jgi:glyoxylase-like metal-dependent hydrolase (beta-lactamase superfamily II)
MGGVPDVRALYPRVPVGKLVVNDPSLPVPMEPLGEGTVLRGDGVTLRALHTPGHASDHLCYYLEEERALFTGDVILGGSTTVIPPDDGDLGDYLASLRRVLALDVQRIYPAHGPVLEPARPVIEGYIAHRLEREAQILATLAAGAETVPDIVARVYREVAPALHPVARLSVLSHLAKLERESRIIRMPGDPPRFRLA